MKDTVCPQKKKLLLITNGFPFGQSERGFLTTEFKRLQEEFDVFLLAVAPQQSEAAWKALDTDPDKTWCTGYPELHPISVLAQIFKWDVLNEVGRVIGAGGSFKLMLKRISLVLRYSSRAQIYGKKIHEICSSHQIDVIYTYWCTQATLAAIREKRKQPALQVITRFHGYDLYQERMEELWQPFRHDIAQKCGLLVFACKAGMEYFLTHWKNVDTEKILMSYLGCRPMERVGQADSDALILVSCSNLIALKRVDYIINALAILPENIRINWHHFGDGVLREALEAQATEKLSDKKNISWSFHGAVPNSQLDACYRTLRPDVFITTSSTEGGAPVSIQEAFAMGIPAIGTAVGGIPELIIPGKSGWLLPAEPTIQQVAEAIAAAANLPAQERQRLRYDVFRYRKDNFNSKQTASQFVRTLSVAVSDKGNM